MPLTLYFEQLFHSSTFQQGFLGRLPVCFEREPTALYRIAN